MLWFWCPGCDGVHQIRHTSFEHPVWTWNYDLDRPTLTPSVLVTGTQPMTGAEHTRIMAGEKITPRPLRCHSFITNGRIQFLADCTHALAGQTVDLPDWDAETMP